MHHAKNRGNKVIPLAILSRILAHNSGKGVTHDCASILDSIAKGITLFPQFFACCIPSIHSIEYVFALVVYCTSCNLQCT